MIRFSSFIAEITKEFDENFLSWFGKSKVVDKDGNPLVVYHGSKSDFKTFDIATQGKDKLKLGGGFYFTNIKKEAESYGKVKSFYLRIENPLVIDNYSHNLSLDIVKKFLQEVEQYLDVDKEKLLKKFEEQKYEDMLILHDITFAMNYKERPKFGYYFNKISGFDGVINRIRGVSYSEGLFEYVVYDPQQIKPANEKV